MTAGTNTTAGDAGADTVGKGRPQARLIATVLRARETVEKSSGRLGRARLARFRSALTPATELAAAAVTEAPLDGMAAHRRPGARRAAAIAAANPKVKHTDGFPVGASLRMLHARPSPMPGFEPGSLVDGQPRESGMTRQIDALPLLDVENAALVLAGLIGRCAEHGVPINFYDLADTLTYWGDGTDDISRDRRLRIVGDFYGASEYRVRKAVDEGQSEGVSKTPQN